MLYTFPVKCLQHHFRQIVYNIKNDGIQIFCHLCVASFLLLYAFPVKSRFKSHCLRQVSESFHALLCCRFCICMLHEQFTCWLCTLHNIILAHHDQNCECDCGFCAMCGDLESISISTCMRLILCPPSLRFHGSCIPPFDWNCIED